MILWGGHARGPPRPGRFTVRMHVDGHTITQPLRQAHPLFTDVTEADLQAQFDLAIRIRDKVSEANQAVIDIRRNRDSVDDRLKDSGRACGKRARLKAALAQVERRSTRSATRAGRIRSTSPSRSTIGWPHCWA